jgi:hypothetical protein
MNNIIYAIGDDPYCLWESDINDAAASFLRSIDHDYFHYIAERSSVDLEDPDKGMRAATSMRLALFHGGETLFLLIGALLQAPRCPHAWIGQCSTTELRTVIDRINAGQPFLMQNTHIRNVSWLDISREVLSRCPPDTSGLSATIESFAKFWELLALNHTDQSSIDEYNSLKHGFRVAHGGFEIMMGTHPSGSVPPAQQEMKSLGSSKWGAAFRVIKKFDNDVKGSRSRQSIHTAVNWDAGAVSISLHLVAHSIRNVVTYLGVFSGLKELQFRLPQPEAFEAASKRVGLQSMSMPMATAAARSTTKEQLMIKIKKTSAKGLVRALKDVVRIQEGKLIATETSACAGSGQVLSE